MSRVWPKSLRTKKACVQLLAPKCITVRLLQGRRKCPPPLPHFFGHGAFVGGGGYMLKPPAAAILYAPALCTPPTRRRVFQRWGGWGCIKFGTVRRLSAAMWFWGSGLHLNRTQAEGCCTEGCWVVKHFQSLRKPKWTQTSANLGGLRCLASPGSLAFLASPGSLAFLASLASLTSRASLATPASRVRRPWRPGRFAAQSLRILTCRGTQSRTKKKPKATKPHEKAPNNCLDGSKPFVLLVYGNGAGSGGSDCSKWVFDPGPARIARNGFLRKNWLSKSNIGLFGCSDCRPHIRELTWAPVVAGVGRSVLATRGIRAIRGVLSFWAPNGKNWLPKSIIASFGFKISTRIARMSRGQTRPLRLQIWLFGSETGLLGLLRAQKLTFRSQFCNFAMICPLIWFK